MNVSVVKEEVKSNNGMFGNEIRDIRKLGEKCGFVENICVEKYDINIYCEVQKVSGNGSVFIIDKIGESSKIMICDIDFVSGDYFL